MNKPDKIATDLVELEGLIELCNNFFDASKNHEIDNKEAAVWGEKFIAAVIGTFYGKPGIEYLVKTQEAFWNEEP